MLFFAAYDLIGFVTFAAYRNDIAALCLFYHPFQRLFSISNYNILSG